MYGLIGKMNAVPGQRDALIAAMQEDVPEMSGCLSYIIAIDPADENAVWVTEVWESRESHAASLDIPEVKKAIEKAMPLITGMDVAQETVPVAGHGLKPSLGH